MVILKHIKTGKIQKIASKDYLPGGIRKDWEEYEPVPVVIPEVLKSKTNQVTEKPTKGKKQKHEQRIL